MAQSILPVVEQIYKYSDNYKIDDLIDYIKKIKSSLTREELNNVLYNLYPSKLRLSAAIQIASHTHAIRADLFMWNEFIEQCSNQFGRQHFSHLPRD